MMGGGPELPPLPVAMAYRAPTLVTLRKLPPRIRATQGHLVKLTRKGPNLHPHPDRSAILETDREGPQVWSGRPTVSDRSTPTLG